MSFILDALRKSETERQRQALPGIADTRQRGRPAQNRWLPLLVVLLAGNALLVGWMLLRDRPPPAAATAQQQPRTTSAEQAPLAGTPSVHAAARPASSRALSDTTPPPAEPPATAARANPVADARPPPHPASNTAAGDDNQPLPSLQQLVLAGVLNLRPLHLDMHVYSSDPRQRFVFMNMRKYREGETLREGPVLEQITPDGVILSQHGQRFTVARE